MEPFIGQIQAFGFKFTPRGWALCNGQLLSISEYSALFSLLGTTYGGDGRTSFGLPDLRSRSMVGIGAGPGFSTIIQGEKGGHEQITLTQMNLPSHSHTLQDGVANVTVNTTDNSATTSDSDGGSNGLGTGTEMPSIFREDPTTADKIGGVSISGQTNVAGGDQSFNNRNPFLGINICIALNGTFPSRN